MNLNSETETTHVNRHVHTYIPTHTHTPYPPNILLSALNNECAILSMTNCIIIIVTVISANKFQRKHKLYHGKHVELLTSDLLFASEISVYKILCI